jgi:predicted metal-dependent peptidase
MVVDVSGSVSGVEGKVQRLIGEVWSSAVDLGVGATLLFCDTELRQCRAKGVPEFRNFIDIERGESIPTDIEFGYGGGTSYGPVFEYIRERFGDKISALIYATDGECASPIPDTPYPQLWLIPRSDCIEQSLNERWPWPAYYGFGSGAWCAPPVYGSSMSPYDWTKVRASFPHSVIAIDDTLTDPYHDQEGDA